MPLLDNNKDGFRGDYADYTQSKKSNGERHTPNILKNLDKVICKGIFKILILIPRSIIN